MDWPTPFFLLVLVTWGCTNEARSRCQKWCASEKDTCMLEATNAEEIHGCDKQSLICTSGCP